MTPVIVAGTWRDGQPDLVDTTMELPEVFREQGFLTVHELAEGLVNMDSDEQTQALALIAASGERRLVAPVVRFARLFAQGADWLPVFDTVHQLGGKLALRTLCRWSRERSDPWHRLGLVHKLSNMEDPEFLILRTLRQIAGDGKEYPEIRGHALEGLGYRQSVLDRRGVRYQRTAEVVRKCLESKHADVRFWASFAAGQARDKKALRALRRLRSDKAQARGFWTVGEEARDAVNLIKGLIEEAPERETTPPTRPVSWERQVVKKSWKKRI